MRQRNVRCARFSIILLRTSCGWHSQCPPHQSKSDRRHDWCYGISAVPEMLRLPTVDGFILCFPVPTALYIWTTIMLTRQTKMSRLRHVCIFVMQVTSKVRDMWCETTSADENWSCLRYREIFGITSQCAAAQPSTCRIYLHFSQALVGSTYICWGQGWWFFRTTCLLLRYQQFKKSTRHLTISQPIKCA